MEPAEASHVPAVFAAAGYQPASRRHDTWCQLRYVVTMRGPVVYSLPGDGRILSTAGRRLPWQPSPAKERLMAAKQPGRRGFLKSGAALAGGLTVGAVAPASAQEHPEFIKGNKELIAYGD